MRLSLFLALGLVLCALPAAANSPMHGGGSPNHHFAVHHNRQFTLRPLPEVGGFFFPFGTRFGGFANNGFFGGRGFGDRGFGGGYWGGGYFGGTGYDLGGFVDPPAGPAREPTVIAMAPPPRPLGDDRATVETTASGVTIIRGPGSHHR